MTQTLVKNTQAEDYGVCLSHLIKLSTTDLHNTPMGTFATRPIDTAHVKALARTIVLDTRDIELDGVTVKAFVPDVPWPYIQVCELRDTTIKDHPVFGIVDGNHRYEAITRSVTCAACGLDEDASDEEYDTAVATLTPEQKSAIGGTLVAIVIGAYASDKEVIQAAITANLKHGAPPTNRSDLAYAMFNLTRGDTPEPSQSEIARVFGISRQTLSEKISKMQADEERSVKEVTSKDSGGTPPTDDTAKKLLKAFDTFMKKFAEVAGVPENKDVIEKVSHALLLNGMMNTHDRHTDDDDSTYTEALRALIASATTGTEGTSVTALVTNLTRFNKNLAQAVKKITPKAEKGVTPPVNGKADKSVSDIPVTITVSSEELPPA